jgi:lysophospholipid acyltransferase (LPLAT)-like uncharacterized protein
MAGIRRRIEGSVWLARLLGGLIGLWLRLCHATTRWDRQGEDAVVAALQDGPVILILWHECTMLAPVHWAGLRRRGVPAPLSSLRDTSPIGRVSGAVQAHFGLQPMAMADGASNRAASRTVLRRLTEGMSVGLTGDGPLGPVRVLKDAGLDWARVSGRPVFVYAFSVRRHRRLATWDKMILPLPFTRGALAYRAWQGVVPRHPDAAALAALRAGLAAALDGVTDEVAGKVGLDPPHGHR